MDQERTSKVRFRTLDPSDHRRLAWLNADKFSTTWVTAWPGEESALDNAEFDEVAARYFGTPSPACAARVGETIGRTSRRLDPYGAQLAAAPLPGDGFRLQHDQIKWQVFEDLREMGVRARPEVYGIFAAALPRTARDKLGTWTLRKRQGLVPDLLVGLPSPGGLHDRGQLG